MHNRPYLNRFPIEAFTKQVFSSIVALLQPDTSRIVKIRRFHVLYHTMFGFLFNVSPPEIFLHGPRGKIVEVNSLVGYTTCA